MKLQISWLLFFLFLAFGLKAQILLTEIMFDPNPPVGLPETEYIELYNSGSDSIDLGGWIWQVGSKSIVLPTSIMAPQSFLILVQDAAGFGQLGDSGSQLLNLPKWLGLRNSGDYLVLKNQQGLIEHFAEYSPTQFADALKAAGGWSLELQCWDAVYSQQSWQVSTSNLGGSPGELRQQVCDFNNPAAFSLVQAGYLDDYQFLLKFNQFLDPKTSAADLSLSVPHSYVINWHFYQDRCDQIAVEFENPLSHGASHLIEIDASLRDCYGQSLRKNLLRIGIPEPPDTGELLISELMFDPGSKGVEYLELYNPSQHFIDLNQLIVAKLDELEMVADFSNSGKQSCLLPPQGYAVICADRFGLLTTHPEADTVIIHLRTDLPTLTNSGGKIQIMNGQQQVIDRVSYDPDWHYFGLDSQQGVALERIDLRVSGLLSQNWFSAAASEHFATPGRPNSQSLMTQASDNESFKLLSEVFTPNQDGHNDVLLISIALPELGWEGFCEIRNTTGLLVNTILDWGLLPQNGVIQWDGSDRFGRMSPPGIYVILLNYNKANGMPGRWKRACGLIND